MDVSSWFQHFVITVRLSILSPNFVLTCPLADMEEIIRDSEIVLVLIPWLKSRDDPMKPSAVETLSKLGLYDNT